MLCSLPPFPWAHGKIHCSIHQIITQSLKYKKVEVPVIQNVQDFTCILSVYHIIHVDTLHFSWLSQCILFVQVIELCPDATLLDSLRECNKLLDQVRLFLFLCEKEGVRRRRKQKRKCEGKWQLHFCKSRIFRARSIFVTWALRPFVCMRFSYSR